ncbi:MAG: fibrillarin-like rRNA/tRNA 2'-O-methyltransferase [Conexivisphaerales archaeon]
MEVIEVVDGIYRVRVEDSTREYLATLNLAPGISVYGERLLQYKGKEFRLWDPFRSKLAAAILKGLKDIAIARGSRILYLGASTGTTVSHVSDIVGKEGIVFAVEVSQRVARELMEHVARYRKNVIPIVEDARRPERYSVVYGRIDVVYCDIAQPDQTEIAVLNADRYLRNNGRLLLVVKARSIDVLSDPRAVIRREAEKVSARGYEVRQVMELDPYDKDHGIVLAAKK